MLAKLFWPFLSVSLLAQAGVIETASQYNVFVFNSFTLTNSDSEGSVAVGGNATISGSSIGADLVEGGNLNFSNGSVKGSITTGGTASVSGAGVGGGVHQNSSSLPVNFASIQAGLTSDSQYWSTLAPTGTYTDSYGQITLNGNNANLDIFNLKASDLANANTFTFGSSLPSTATIIINVDGASDQMQNFGFFRNHAMSQDIIFNFYQATSLNISGIGVDGSILAPLATVNFSNGHIDGNLFAKNESGSGEFHATGKDNPGQGGNVLFAGNVPEPTPEPSTLSLLGMGVALVFAGAMRRRAS
jgi:choice-of-anchor A domain-containing protein